MNTDEGNKIIAEFMGMPPRFVEYPDKALSRWEVDKDNTWQPMEYDKSWDWLMPVWRKCIDVIGLWAHTHKDDNKSKVWLRAGDNIRLALTSVDINAAVREIVGLIQWYNQYKKP